MRDARYLLHKIGKMPLPFHQFWLQDMEFSNGEQASLVRKPKEGQDCRYAFFPGCQLGAAGPEYVAAPYRKLLELDPATGLMLRCCGIPAEWAGDKACHQASIEGLRRQWAELGNPILITACPACRRHLSEYIPELQTVSLYEALDKGKAGNDVANSAQEMVVFDPCTARSDICQQEAVRSLAVAAGLSVAELPQGAVHGCCGYGGHIDEADPKLRGYITESRIKSSDLPFLVYCINCRDIFRQEGKAARHILELLFDLQGADLPLPGVDQRRENRRLLKKNLLMEMWNEEYNPSIATEKCVLHISAPLRDKLNKKRILEQDICQVITAAEATGRRVIKPQSSTFACYQEIGSTTLWVEYRKTEDGFEVVNVYSHRLKIELEAIWKGKKTEAFKELPQ